MYDIEKMRTSLLEEGKVKQCAKCNKILPATTDNFYKSKQNKSGLYSYCKECTLKRCREYRKTKKGKETTQKYYEKNREKFRQYNAKRYKGHEKEYYQYQKEYRENHPEKSKRTRKTLFKETLFTYFLKRYFKYEKEALIRHKLFYTFLLELAKKFNVTYSQTYITLLLKRNKKIILPFLRERHKGTRLNQRVIQGIKLNEKGAKKFGISNLCNLEIEENEITQKKACILMSCLPGQMKLEEIYKNLDTYFKDHIHYSNALTYYKKIEAFLFRKNIPRRSSVKIATAFYLASDLSQDKCAEFCEITSVAVRSLLKDILKLKIGQIEKIKKANKTEAMPNEE